MMLDLDPHRRRQEAARRLATIKAVRAEAGVPGRHFTLHDGALYATRPETPADREAAAAAHATEQRLSQFRSDRMTRRQSEPIVAVVAPDFSD